MPRMLRIEYPGALYHVMSRGERREDVFHDDSDRQDFLKTLGEACLKADFLVHAYCLMSNHFHLVLETPKGNLVAGMRWFLSSYTLRLNHRRQLVGHVFGGRYKAIPVEGDDRGDGYFKTVCDYVHLNPSRAKMLGGKDRLQNYPWSSLGYYLDRHRNRPAWLRADRLFQAHGIESESGESRDKFEQRMEARRRSERKNDPEWAPLKRGWCIGGREFRKQLLERIERERSGNHSGEMRQGSSMAKAERIIQEELASLGWTESDLLTRKKGDPAKLALADRLRKETILTVNVIANRLHLGTPKSVRSRLRSFRNLMQSRSQQSTQAAGGLVGAAATSGIDPIEDIYLL